MAQKKTPKAVAKKAPAAKASSGRTHKVRASRVDMDWVREEAAKATSAKGLASAIGVSPTTMRRWVEKYDIQTPNCKKLDTSAWRHTSQRRLSAKERTKILEMRKAGTTFRAIAQKLKCSVSTVYDIINTGK